MPGNRWGADVHPRDILEFYPEATLVINSAGTVIAWNKAMEEMTGVPAKEMIGKGDHEYSLAFYSRRRPILIDLLDMPAEQVEALYSDVRMSNGRLEAMTENVRLKGRDVVLWGVTGRLYGPDGKAVGAIESIRDVTEQVRTARELKIARQELEWRVEERTAELARARGILQATMDTIPIGVVLANADNGLISYATRSATVLFGAEMVGIDVSNDEKPFRLLNPDGSPLPVRSRPLHRSLFYGEQISAEEVQVERADGSTITTLASSAPVRDRDGRITAAVLCVMDITERKQVELALAESEKKFRVLAETLASAVFIYQDEKLPYVNPALEKITGYDEDELRDMGYWGFIHPDHREMVRQRGIDRLNGIPVPSRYEVRILTKAGEERWLDVAAALVDYNGRPAGLMTAFDITERKKAEEALMEAKQQAELYLDLMGHDINNMNQIALGYLELAQNTLAYEGYLNRQHSILLSKPTDTLRNASTLISNVRKLQREKTGQYALSNIDIDSLLRDIIRLNSSVPNRDVTINYEPCGDSIVKANELLRDVFANLVGNAIKHSEDIEKLLITIRVEKAVEEGTDYCKVSVEDNGHGIPETMKATLFDRLSLDITRARGKGFGLCLIKLLVDDYHGKFWVEDRVKGDHKKGARFVVMLPEVGD
jgi:PAS domain S-box-containing protein